MVVDLGTLHAATWLSYYHNLQEWRAGSSLFTFSSKRSQAFQHYSYALSMGGHSWAASSSGGPTSSAAAAGGKKGHGQQMAQRRSRNTMPGVKQVSVRSQQAASQAAPDSPVQEP